LNWQAPSTGEPPVDYVLEAATSPTFSPVVFGPEPIGSATSASVTAPVGILGTYYLRVSARNANGTGPPSNIVDVVFTAQSSAPGKPGTPAVQVNGDGSILVTWQPPATGAAPTAYRAYLDQGGGPVTGSPFLLPPATAVRSPGPLAPGAYALAVSGLAGSVEGPRSDAAVFEIPGACTGPPSAPTGLVITSLGGLGVRLAWTAPTGPNVPASYRLQAALDASFTAIVLDTNVGNVTMLEGSASPGTFFVRVAGVNDCGMGAASGTVEVTLP